jgi:hypothetical protein
MTFHLSPEQQQLVGQAMQAGLIQSANDVVDMGIETLRQRLETHLALPPAIPPEQWSRELHVWVRSHSTTSPLLSDEAIDRDSIYGTRGM